MPKMPAIIATSANAAVRIVVNKSRATNSLRLAPDQGSDNFITSLSDMSFAQHARQA